MYVRISTFEQSADAFDSSTRYFEEVVLPEARKLSGFTGALLLFDRENGRSRSLTYWTSREALEASAEAANRLRANYVEDTQGARLVSVEIYEVAAQEGRASLAEAA